MIVFLSAVAALGAVVWVGYTAARRCPEWETSWMVVAPIQLAMLAMLGWPIAMSSTGSTTLRAVLAGTAVVLLAVSSWRTRSVSVVVCRWAALYSLVVLVSGVASSDRAAALVSAARVIATLAVFVQTSALLSAAIIRRLLAEFVIGTSLLVATGAILAPGPTFATMRSPLFDFRLESAVTMQGSELVGLLGVGLVLLAATSLDSNKTRLVLGLLGAAFVGLTQRRLFYIAGFTGLLTYVHLLWRRWTRPLLIVVAATVLALVLVPSLRVLWDREITHPEAKNITSYRVELLRESLDRFGERPIIGDGLGVGDRNLEIPIGDRTWPSHSEYGTALAATGLLGAAAIAWGHISAAILAWRRWRTSDDWLPLVVTVASISVLPFLVILPRMSLNALPYLTLLLPLFPHKTYSLGSRANV